MRKTMFLLLITIIVAFCSGFSLPKKVNEIKNTVKEDVYNFTHPIQAAKKELKKEVLSGYDKTKEKAKKDGKKFLVVLFEIVRESLGVIIAAVIATILLKTLNFGQLAWLANLLGTIIIIKITAYKLFEFIRSW